MQIHVCPYAYMYIYTQLIVILLIISKYCTIKVLNQLKYILGFLLVKVSFAPPPKKTKKNSFY